MSVEFQKTPAEYTAPPDESSKPAEPLGCDAAELSAPPEFQPIGACAPVSGMKKTTRAAFKWAAALLAATAAATAAFGGSDVAREAAATATPAAVATTAAVVASSPPAPSPAPLTDAEILVAVGTWMRADDPAYLLYFAAGGTGYECSERSYADIVWHENADGSVRYAQSLYSSICGDIHVDRGVPDYAFTLDTPYAETWDYLPASGVTTPSPEAAEAAAALLCAYAWASADSDIAVSFFADGTAAFLFYGTQVQATWTVDPLRAVTVLFAQDVIYSPDANSTVTLYGGSTFIAQLSGTDEEPALTLSAFGFEAETTLLPAELSEHTP